MRIIMVIAMNRDILGTRGTHKVGINFTVNPTNNSGHQFYSRIPHDHFIDILAFLFYVIIYYLL